MRTVQEGRRYGRAALVALAVVAVASAALGTGAIAKPKKKTGPVKPNAGYVGETSQGSICWGDSPCSAALTADRSGKRVSPELQYVSSCEDGRRFSYELRGEAKTVRKDGVLHGEWSRVASGEDAGLALTFEAHLTTTIDATFDRAGRNYSVSGTFVTAGPVHYSDGSETHCSTGPVSFTLVA
jgi:hypothetical protein